MENLKGIKSKKITIPLDVWYYRTTSLVADMEVLGNKLT